ncbi:kinase C-binding 1, partial [Schistosoma japonicum]
RGGQTKTWQKSMKSLTNGLSHVGRCRLRGWGPRDESHQWLETLNDMAQNRLQWRRCIHSLCSLKIYYSLINQSVVYLSEISLISCKDVYPSLLPIYL